MNAEDLWPFQRRFLRAALVPGIDTAALSIPRGKLRRTVGNPGRNSTRNV